MLTHRTQRNDCKREIDYADFIIKINDNSSNNSSKVVKRNSLPGCYAVEKERCFSSKNTFS